MLYQMLSGRMPFEAETQGQLIHQRIAAGRTALTTVPGASLTLRWRKLPSLIG